MSDTPRTDAAVHPSKLLRRPDGTFREAVDAVFARQLERELAEAQAEITRLKGEAESWEKVFDKTCEHLAEAKEELNDRRKFSYAVEQALDGVKGDYVEIIVALRKDAERYRYVRSIWGLPDEKFNDEIDAAMKEGK